MRSLQSVTARPNSFAGYHPMIRALAAGTLLSVGLGVARVVFSRHGALFWLSGNLFLAWIPLFFAWSVRRALDDSTPEGLANRSRRVTPRAVGWLLFFPNAPYLITDFVHLHPRPPVPIWFDIMLFMSFAWTGLTVGFLSLRILHDAVTQRRDTTAGRCFAASALALGSFGVYMGREGRWNSWDVLRHPFGLIRWCAQRFTPDYLPATVGFCGTMFLFLAVVYATLLCLFDANTTARNSQL